MDKLKKEAKPPHETAILTFNYDIAFDYAFFNRGSPQSIDYGLKNSSDRIPTIPILKLHGSLNWLQCQNQECKKITCILEDLNLIPTMSQESFYIDIENSIKNKQCSCGGYFDPEPLIIPPTWNKTDYHRYISPVWERAAEELSQAENIFVIGYSLPPSDEFFKYLYALGTVGKNILKRLWVFNPELPDTVGGFKERFQKLLGPAARSCFEYFPTFFNSPLNVVEETNLTPNLRDYLKKNQILPAIDIIKKTFGIDIYSDAILNALINAA